jgi:hypothetical protein
MAGGSASDTKGSPKPYSAGKNAKNPNNASKGFAHEGDNDLKYEPETTVKKSTHGGEEINSWPKSDSVAEWLHKTRKLSNAKFINEMQSETCSYGTIKDAVAECANSSKGVSHLVMELKRHGLLEVFAAEICKHEATLSVVVEKLQKNPTFLRQLNEYGAMMAKYMNSEMPEDENGDMEGDEDMEGKEDMEGEMGDEGEGDEDEGEGDEDEMGDEDEGEMDDENEDEDEGDEDEGNEDEMGDSALDEPINGDDDSGRRRRHRNHAKHALKNMGTPPGPIDSM